MEKKEKILRPVGRIGRGVHLPHLKATAEKESVYFYPDTVTVPLLQNIGAPCVPKVKKGDKVFVGTVIGDSEAFVSSPVHSSVSGTVAGIIRKEVVGNPTDCVVIDSDGKFEKDPGIKPFKVESPDDLATAARLCGLVGLGGAGFPTHIKLSPQKGSVIDTLIVNAAECEPYITSDYRECMECSDDVMNCIYLICEKLNLNQVIICVENNKPKAISKLYDIAADKRDTDQKVRLMKLPSTYPQGAEKVLIYSATGRKLPLGKLPGDVGCIVMNVTSLGTLWRFISTGMPLTSKRITFDGTAVNTPQNIIVPIGTSVSDIIKFAGGVSDDADRIIIGGPMMGHTFESDDAVVEKRTNAVLVMKQEQPIQSTPCIRCGRCSSSCPMRLYPAKVETAIRCKNTDAYSKLNVNYCMECGICSYVCPAKRPLTQSMRLAKAELRRNKK